MTRQVTVCDGYELGGIRIFAVCGIVFDNGAFAVSPYQGEKVSDNIEESDDRMKNASLWFAFGVTTMAYVLKTLNWIPCLFERDLYRKLPSPFCRVSRVLPN